MPYGRATKARANQPAQSYAHMCRDEHIQIGHNDSRFEQCPLCRLNNALNAIEDMAQQALDAPGPIQVHVLRDIVTACNTAALTVLEMP